MKRKRMSALEIGAKIRAGENFRVYSERERKAALQAAKYAGVKISTRATSATETEGFDIYFLAEPVIK